MPKLNKGEITDILLTLTTRVNELIEERDRTPQARLDAWQSDDTRIVYTCRRWNAVASAMWTSVQLSVAETDGEFFKPRTVASGMGRTLAEAVDDAFKKLDLRYQLEAANVT